MGMDLTKGIKVYLDSILATRSISFKLRTISNIERSLAEYSRGELTRANNVKELMEKLNM